MTPKDIAEFDRFLSTVGKADLFDYFGVPPEASSDDVAAAIQKRRGWAQGQQANPKYKAEALWVIKNVSRVRRALLENRSDYRAHIQGKTQEQQREVLRMVIFGALVGGVLTRASESAVAREGAKLGLPDDVIDETIEAMLREHGARREADAGADAPFVDYYAILRLSVDADQADIDRAYRDRYREALQLTDKARAEVLQGHLDQALKVLKDPGLRVRHDAKRADLVGEEDSLSPPTLGTHGGAPERELEASDTHHRIQFRDGDAPEPELPTPSVPAPPDGISSTLGFTDHKRSSMELKAILQVDGPEVVPLSVRSRPLTHTVVVRKDGDGRLPGRVMVDRDWVEVQPTRLDPTASEQNILVTVYPERMTRRRAVALVTFTTDDSQRQAVTLEVQRASTTPLLVGGAAAALLLLGVGGALFFQSPPEQTVQSAQLQITVDPPAGQITVDNKPVGEGSVTITDGLEPGATAFVRVALDGYRPWSESVTLPGPGESLRLSPSLELSERVNFVPGTDDVEGTLDDAAASATLATVDDALVACARDHGAPTGAASTLAVSVYVDNRGVVVGAEVEPDGFDSNPELTGCARRQLRALKMPFVQGDYARVNRRVRVPPTP